MIERSSLQRQTGWGGFLRARWQLLVAGFLLGNLIAFILTALQPSSAYYYPRNYIYREASASNGVKLHTIRTIPQNIALKHITSNVTQTDEFGINGGFFWEGYLLSIAVVNDMPLKGQPEDYGSGWYNIDVPKGTLVWDEITRRFSVQVVQDVHDLQVTDKGHYWAQGGVSMSLQHDSDWVAQAVAEEMPAFDERRLRSGVVYDNDQNVWMIVTETRCTVEQFRAAVREIIGQGRAVDGVFLDGDGSSQMRIAQKLLKGDSREVYQMMALKHR
jgi:hypothetical protein